MLVLILKTTQQKVLKINKLNFYRHLTGCLPCHHIPLSGFVLVYTKTLYTRICFQQHENVQHSDIIWHLILTLSFFSIFFSRCFWISWLENLELLSLVVGLLQNLNFVNIYQTGFLQCFKTMFFIYTQVNEYVKKVNFQHISNSLIKIFSVLKSLQSALVNPSVTSLATQIIQPNYYLSDYMKDCPVLK
jgi:hypothetical protein